MRFLDFYLQYFLPNNNALKYSTCDYETPFVVSGEFSFTPFTTILQQSPVGQAAVSDTILVDTYTFQHLHF